MKVTMATTEKSTSASEIPFSELPEKQVKATTLFMKDVGLDTKDIEKTVLSVWDGIHGYIVMLPFPSGRSGIGMRWDTKKATAWGKAGIRWFEQESAGSKKTLSIGL